MAPPTWATDSQREFLLKEDASWELIKNSGRTLKSFYTQTTRMFLEKWPRTPSSEILAMAKGNEAEAKALVEQQTWVQIVSWFGNQHRKKKGPPAVQKPLLDLAGKHARKKPPLQKWQAFSALYYRPTDSPLRAEVKSLFDQRHEPTAVQFLADFLPPNTDIAKTDFLIFLGAFLRKRCTHLSSDEEEQVQVYIKEQEQLATEHCNHPWVAEDDYNDKPLLAENRYVQQRIDELPRVAQRALDEIERATGYKAILLVGGLTPADDGAISTYIHTTGHGIATGLSFSESWDGIPGMRDAFGEWLKIAFSESEKRRREGFSASSLAPPSDPSADNITPNGIPDDTAPGNIASNGTMPGNTASDDVAPGDLTFGNMNFNHSNSDDTNSDEENSDIPTNNLEPGNTTSDNVQLDNTTPANAEPDNATLDNAEPDNATLDNAEPDNTTSDDTEPDSTPPDNLTLATPRESTPTTSNEDPVITPSPAAQKGATPLTRSVLIPTPRSTTPAHTFEHDQSYPTFITPAALEYLNSVDGGLRWVEMVKYYLTLEGQYCSRRMGRLSLQHRPEEVVLWARQRDLPPSITDVQKFSEAWIAWWGNCQPKWRSTETWPYPRDDAKEKDWARLNVTGTSGLFAVVMSTSWWAAAAGSGSHRGELDSAIEDLCWVIENLLHFNSRLPVVGTGRVDAPEADHFPGHGARDPGKRKIKPTPKVSNRT